MGVLECHQLTPLNKMMELKNLRMNRCKFGGIITTGKKRYSHLSGGCPIIIMTGKKSSSRLSGGCAIIITTGKKRYSHLSGGCPIIIMTGKKKF